MKITKNKKRFNQLSWEILEHKFRYYEGAKYNLKPIDDFEYDLLEAEYISLAKKLKLPPSASDMVGFDYTRPSCKLVADTLIESSGKKKAKQAKKKFDDMRKELRVILDDHLDDEKVKKKIRLAFKKVYSP